MKYFKSLGFEIYRVDHGCSMEIFGKMRYVRLGCIAKLDFFIWTPYKRVGKSVYFFGFVFNGTIKGNRYFCRYVG